MSSGKSLKNVRATTLLLDLGSMYGIFSLLATRLLCTALPNSTRHVFDVEKMLHLPAVVLLNLI